MGGPSFGSQSVAHVLHAEDDLLRGRKVRLDHYASHITKGIGRILAAKTVDEAMMIIREAV